MQKRPPHRAQQRGAMDHDVHARMPRPEGVKNDLARGPGVRRRPSWEALPKSQAFFFFDFFKRVSWNIIYMPENLPLFSSVIFSIFTELYHHRENFILLPQKETPYPSFHSLNNVFCQENFKLFSFMDQVFGIFDVFKELFV